MKELESGSFLNPPIPRVWPETIKVVSWNVNRGLELGGVIDFLGDSCADLILLQETDIHARRTELRNIPREIAQALGMDYIFGLEFQELAQGSTTTPAYHGQTTLSRLPLSNPRILRFRNQSKFWTPRWFIPRWQCLQRRRGGRMALICEINLQGKTLAIYNVHLESRGNSNLRIAQLTEMLVDVSARAAHTPVLMTGDFNFDLSVGPAAELLASTRVNNLGTSMGRSTVPNGFTRGSRAIDWILTRGALVAIHSEINSTVTASDHFPLSLEFRFL
jgi:endonuclease/exonuclease/phosphatase family metal-dependent hydrolase